MKFYNIVFIFLSFFCNQSWAQVGPTVDSMGGAGIAAIQGIDSAAVNPAGLVFLQNFFMGTQYFRGAQSGSTQGDQYSFHLVDGTNEGAFPGALTYRRRQLKLQQNQGTVTEHLFRLGFAFRLVENLAMGVALYRMQTDWSLMGRYRQQNADVSLLWRWRPELAVGILSKTVFGSDSRALYPGTRFVPATGLGVEYMSENFLVRTDIYTYHDFNPHHRMSYPFGGGVRMRDGFIFRTGWAIDDYQRQDRYSLGITWEGPRLKAGYSYQKEYRQSLGDSHSFDIWLNL